LPSTGQSSSDNTSPGTFVSGFFMEQPKSMSSKTNILIQIDPDLQPSVFDAVVAVDADVDHLFRHGGVSVEDVEGIVHGAIFTRGPKDLQSTALFFGGSNVEKTQQLVEKAKSSFFGPMRVSLLSDPNGSNTTAAAAVICAARHTSLSTGVVTILGATGPVGQRVSQIIGSMDGATTEIRICSRTIERATACCEAIEANCSSNAKLTPTAVPDQDAALVAIGESEAIFAAGAAGIQFLGSGWQSDKIANPKVVVDLNAVPPAGIDGVEVTDSGREVDGCYYYGAIGVGGLKMKIHKQCIRSLFQSNSLVLDTNEVFAIGESLA